MSRLIAYLSGPMSGIPEYNVPLFNEVTQKLRTRYPDSAVFNPAENFAGRLDLPRATYMLADFKHLLRVAEEPGFDERAIIMLPGWSGSKGACAELTVAQELGLRVYAWLDDRLVPCTGPFVLGKPVLGCNMDPCTATTGGSGVEVRITNSKTGGQKGQKPERLDLVPSEPLLALSRIYAYGAKKYDDHNWRKGYAWSLSYAAMLRHMLAFWDGQDNDPESGLPHLGHAAFHCFSLLQFMEHYKDGDDRPAK